MNLLKRSTKVFIDKMSNGIFATHGKLNFRNMSRYIDIDEKTISRNYKKADLVDITQMNNLGIREIFKEENKNILAIDCSFIKKSGNKTYGLDKFWDGKNVRANKGLEISLLSLVDTTYNTAYSINVVQTPSKFKSDESRVLHYLKQLEDNKEYFKEVNFVVGDGFYSKKTFVDGVKEMGKSYVGKLRSDANLRYIYDGEQTGLKGANKKYDGKVFYDKHEFDYVITLKKGQDVYTKIVNSIFLKSEIRIVFLVNKYKKHRILFSTDINLSALDILDYYSSRFQIEFLFRDSKMYTGLEDCQSTDKKILDTHFNMSLFALNLAKLEDRILKGEDNQLSFSMLNYKVVSSNMRILDLFIHKFDVDMSYEKMRLAYDEMLTIGTIAC